MFLKDVKSYSRRIKRKRLISTSYSDIDEDCEEIRKKQKPNKELRKKREKKYIVSTYFIILINYITICHTFF